MAADLQALLDKIQTEGVDKAETEARRIVDEARQKAATIVAEAEKQQASAKAAAETEARLLQSRAEQSIRIAARDVLLGVSASLDQTLKRLLLDKISSALTPEFLQTFVADVIKSYAESPDAAQGIEVRIPPAQADQLRDYLLQSFRESAAGGIRVSPDSDTSAGFRVSLADGRIEHDFSAPAIQAAMARLLRPALADLLTTELPQ